MGFSNECKGFKRRQVLERAVQKINGPAPFSEAARFAGFAFSLHIEDGACVGCPAAIELFAGPSIHIAWICAGLALWHIYISEGASSML
jgi:hypothetical protein